MLACVIVMIILLMLDYIHAVLAIKVRINKLWGISSSVCFGEMAMNL